MRVQRNTFDDQIASLTRITPLTGSLQSSAEFSTPGHELDTVTARCRVGNEKSGVKRRAAESSRSCNTGRKFLKVAAKFAAIVLLLLLLLLPESLQKQLVCRLNDDTSRIIYAVDGVRDLYVYMQRQTLCHKSVIHRSTELREER
jgi:hypothetical protein